MAKQSNSSDLGRYYMAAFFGVPLICFGLGGGLKLGMLHYMKLQATSNLLFNASLIGGCAIAGKLMTKYISNGFSFGFILLFAPTLIGFCSAAIVAPYSLNAAAALSVISASTGALVIARDISK